MIHQFYPSVVFEGQEYGNAVLSRFPMKCVKAGLLPGVKNNKKLEVRGAIWTEVAINDSKMQEELPDISASLDEVLLDFSA